MGVLLLVGVLLLPRSVPPAVAWAALPAVVLAGRRPLVLPTAASGSLVVGLDSAGLVLLGLTLPLRQALVVWACSILVGELTTRRTLDTRLFNAGVCVLAGLLALGVLWLVPAAQRTGPVGLAATVGAGAAYFLFDHVWSGLSVAIAARSPLAATLRPDGLLLTVACFLGVDSLGFLGAVLLGAEPWTVVLLAVPFVALLLSTSAWSTLRQTEHRSGVLSVAALALQQARTPEEVEQLVLEHAAVLVRVPAAAWAGPDDADDGGPVLLADPPRRLRLADRASGEALSQLDTDALHLLLGVARQAHERLRLLAELRQSALHDPLTGLANRALFSAELAAACAAGDPVAVVYGDLDGFKQLNDTRGHAVGDALLVAAADRLTRTVRAGDLPARLGGDEFAVLVRGTGDGAGTELAARLCDVLGRPYDLPGGPVRVPASLGVCVRTGDEQPEDLLHASDAAMYAAKAVGGGRVRTHAPAAVPG